MNNDRDLSCYSSQKGTKMLTPPVTPQPVVFNLEKLSDLEALGAHVLVVMPTDVTSEPDVTREQYDIFDLTERVDGEPLRYSIVQHVADGVTTESMEYARRDRLTAHLGQAVFQAIWWKKPSGARADADAA